MDAGKDKSPHTKYKSVHVCVRVCVCVCACVRALLQLEGMKVLPSMGFPRAWDSHPKIIKVLKTSLLHNFKQEQVRSCISWLAVKLPKTGKILPQVPELN